MDTVADAAENSGSSASDAIPSEDVAIVEEAQKEAPTAPRPRSSSPTQRSAKTSQRWRW
ncbi:hypothetical protein [Streptomyces sp. 061-3]|uniref:hypothetical protein n=1 Tax=Streptomyces sp. 061-3 TaxID=2789268 RepID=UPI00398121AA